MTGDNRSKAMNDAKKSNILLKKFVYIVLYSLGVSFPQLKRILLNGGNMVSTEYLLNGFKQDLYIGTKT